MKIAYVIGLFPKISESWFIEQLTDLLDQGADVDIIAFNRGLPEDVSDSVLKYKLLNKTTYLEFPRGRLLRLVKSIPLFISGFMKNPRAVLNSINIFKYGSAARSLKYFFWSVPLIGKIKKYDVIHCHFGMVANNFLRIKEILTINKPLIVTFYGQDSSRYIKAKGNHAYDELKSIVSLLLVMTEEMKERMIKFGFAADKVKVHYTGVASDRYIVKERTMKAGEKFRVIFVGRFTQKKGVEDVLRAFGGLAREYHNSELHLVGDSDNQEYKDKISQIIKELNMESKIIRHGMLSHDRMLNLLSEMHVMLQLSKTAPDGDTDDLPFVLLEAQASGLPVITTDHVGIPEGVDEGGSGFIVPEGDHRGAAQALGKLVNDPELLRQMSIRGPQFMKEKFDLHGLNTKLKNYYERISHY